MIQKLLLGILLFACAAPATSRAQNFLSLAALSPYTHYKTFETKNFEFVYEDGYFDFARRAAMHLEHAHEVLSPILKWQPRYKTTILIADNEDAANGFTMPPLRVGIVLIATPPDAWLSTSWTDDWIKLLVFHEYTHFLNIDPTTGLLEAARIFFGDVIRPNGLWPIWQLEGLAVYYETRTSKLGRGRSPYYESILRAYVDEKRLDTHANQGMTLDRVNGNDPYFPGGEIPYLFGYHLWDQFSRDHTRFQDTDSAMGDLSMRSSNRIPFFIEGNLENVMNKNWSEYWDSFVKESETKFSKQITAVRALGETRHELLTHVQYSAYAGTISPDGRYLAYTESSMKDLSYLVLIDLKTGKRTEAMQKVLGVTLSFTPDSKYVLYSSLERFNTYYLYSDLFSYEIGTGKISQITHGLRAKDPALSPDGKRVAFIHSDHATNGLMTASIEEKNGKLQIGKPEELCPIPMYTILGSPKFVNNREVVYSSQELGKTSSDLKIASLDKHVSRNLIADGEMNRYPEVRNDRIYFVSNRSGIENIHSISKDGKDVKQETNVVTGVEFPFFSPKNELYGSLMTSNGFEIAKFINNAAKPVTNRTIAEASAPPSIPAALTEPTTQVSEQQVKDYSPWSSMAPRSWAPIEYVNYSTYSGTSTTGQIVGFDSTGKQQYSLIGTYNFKTQTLDGTLDYTLSYFRPIINLFASSETFDIGTDFFHDQYRTSKEAGVSLSYPIIWTHSSLTPSLTGFTSWNRVYDLNTRAPIATNDFVYSNPSVPAIVAALVFTDAQSTKLGFMPQTGNTIRLSAEDQINTIDKYSNLIYLAGYQHYFDLGNTSVLTPQLKWLESTHPTQFSYARVQGKQTYDIADDGQYFDLSRLGIRGYSDVILAKKAAGVASLDYHFPINRSFFGFGTLPAFINQLHGFVFGELTYLPSISIAPVTLPAFGGGLFLDTTLLIRVPVRFTLQYQDGLNKDYGGDSLVFFGMQFGSLF